MKTALLLLLSLSYAAPAFSQPANKRAEAEARRFFIPCSKYQKDERIWCPLHQAQFVENYVLAKSGDAMWMADIAARLDPDNDEAHPPSLNAGIRRDPRQACAWIIAEAEATTENFRVRAAQSRYTAQCAILAPNEQRAALERAEVILQEIRDDPTTPPPEPKSTIPDKCLDSTVRPLTTGPDTTPPFVPPPGCPKF